MEFLKVFKSGVFIIGASDGERLNAMTASLVMPASFKPPYLTVSFDENRYTKDIIIETGKFSVSVLTESQEKIGKIFGYTSGREKDKFANFQSFILEDGLPVISNCAAWMICEYCSDIKLGDHLVIGAKVVKSKFGNGKPLLFKQDTFY